MKHIKTILFLFIIFSLFSCKKKCTEGYFIYEVTGYSDTLFERYEQGIVNYLNINEEISYNKLNIYLRAKLKQIDVTEYCSVMNDSLIGYIDTIFIISDNDYNQNYSANGNLNDLFKILYPKDNGMESDLISINDYISKKEKIKQSYYFFLQTAPDSSSLHSFTITIKTTDGKEFNITTIPIKITP